MKRIKVILACIIFACFFVSACRTQGAGPQTWIDLPLDDTTAPLAPLTLMAHSSDNAGVKRIEFYVNGEEVAAQATEGNRLESRRYEWTPLGPGKYKIQARGISGTGEKGPYAVALVTILGQDSSSVIFEDTPQFTPTNTPEITPDVSISPSITTTDTQIPPTTQLPPPTTAPPPPPSNTPKVEIIIPPSIEIDTTDPVISYVNASPDPIYHDVCGVSFDLVVRLTVNATDNVAIDHVGGTWAIGGESGDYNLNHIGGSQYEKDFGPFTTLGPLYFVGSAEDTSGNWTYYETWVTVKNCIE